MATKFDSLTLGFKIWEHPNLKVSTLTIKNQFFEKLVLLPLLRSKMPTTGIRAL